MTRTAQRIAIILSALCLAALAASAQNNRSAVSVNGSDSNPCTTVSPCRSFGAALAATNAGGEVIAIDSGGYGPFTITKAVSVFGAPGVHAALTASLTDGIDVAAGSSDAVRIRNLNITLSGSAFGINATTFGALSIQNCIINGGFDGIAVGGHALSYATVVDTTVSNTSNIAFFLESPTALVRCRAENNNGSLSVRDGATGDGIVSAVDFVAVGNTFGIALNTFTAGHTTALTIDHALVSKNGNGISSFSVASGSATVRVTNSTVTDNGGYGFDQGGVSTFQSTQNNLVAGNAVGPVFGTIDPAPVH